MIRMFNVNTFKLKVKRRRGQSIFSRRAFIKRNDVSVIIKRRH